MRITREKASPFSVFHLIIILQLMVTSSSSTTPTTLKEHSSKCGNLNIRFPFWLKDSQPDHRGYPRFELSCTDNKTVIELPLSGKFLVRKINYATQSMEIYDQKDCIPRRLMGFNLTDTPFKVHEYGNYTFLNCSRDVATYDSRIISCLSSPTYKVVSFDLDDFLVGFSPAYKCKTLADSIKCPWYSNFDCALDDHRLLINWDEPKCGHCEFHGGRCGYNSNLSIGCFGIDKSKGKKIAISLSVGIFVFALSVLIIFIKIRKKADMKEKENQRRIERFLENNALKPTRYSHAEIKKITNKFEIKLGQGGYGSVFKGKLTNGIQVAVKVLDNSDGSNNGEEFVNEVGTIGRIHHLNVVRLLGFCVEGSTRALIYEFMLNSSLDKFIFSAGEGKMSINLGWPKLQEIAIGIARGMDYLHQGCDQRILHFDIKPQNILLDRNFTPKISDFGLAKLCTKDTLVTISMAAARGTMGYIAPEVFSRNFGAVSYKSDVYSFGMLLFEIVGGNKNAMEIRSDEEYFPEWVYNRLNRGEDLGIQAEAEGSEIIKKLTMVALWCIQWNPVNRPSMNGVLRMLEGNTANLLMPYSPFAPEASVSSASRVNRKDETALTVILED
ncbi:hypothetical protein C5167_036511 [Papaver somniferum]|uniref:Protein kinase domain-containing protein n=1 Tax=Papaver somniferum TaxID=3469 RepID=A0A4Y7I3W4_PAPSO|nr:rust resistance kinase Lr10-like [Papaver somniferum]RZC43563.1 hypothetical protein C5167_036511 [Papaver somniferum]